MAGNPRRDSKAVMPRIANPVSPVRLRVAPPNSPSANLVFNAPAPQGHCCLVKRLVQACPWLPLLPSYIALRQLITHRLRLAFGSASATVFARLVAGVGEFRPWRCCWYATPVTHDVSPPPGLGPVARLDEWKVVNPLAVSQTTLLHRLTALNPLHGPHRPSINVASMTAAAIANLDAVTQPATWGVFFWQPLAQNAPALHANPRVQPLSGAQGWHPFAIKQKWPGSGLPSPLH